MRALAVLMLSVCAAPLTRAHDAGVGGFSIKAPLEEPDQQIAEEQSVEVKMRCLVAADGHQIILQATNSGKSKVLCQSRCYFKTSTGLSGLMYGSGFVQPGAQNVQVRTDYFNDFVLTITHPGSFSCK